MGTIRSSLDPTPAQGLAYDIAGLAPERWTATKSGVQTATNGVARFTNDTGSPVELTKVTVSLGTAPAGSAFVVDVNKEGTSVFNPQSGRPSIAAGQKTASAVPSVSGSRVVVAPGEVVTVDVDAIGSGTAGSDLTVTVEAKRTRTDDVTRSDADLKAQAGLI